MPLPPPARPHPTASLELLREQLALAAQQLEEESYAEARGLLDALARRTLALGLESAHLAWMRAVACDGLGEHETALRHAVEAVRLDPLALPYRRSLRLICAHLAEALARPGRAADDPATPRQYALLLGLRAATPDSHLTMARWHLSRGDARSARPLLEALTRLEPWRVEAWRLLVKTLRAAGATEAALEAEREVMARTPSGQAHG